MDWMCFQFSLVLKASCFSQKLVPSLEPDSTLWIRIPVTSGSSQPVCPPIPGSLNLSNDSQLCDEDDGWKSAVRNRVWQRIVARSAQSKTHKPPVIYPPLLTPGDSGRRARSDAAASVAHFCCRAAGTVKAWTLLTCHPSVWDLNKSSIFTDAYDDLGEEMNAKRVSHKYSHAAVGLNERSDDISVH